MMMLAVGLIVMASEGSKPIAIAALLFAIMLALSACGCATALS
jgi:hypothetical protein